MATSGVSSCTDPAQNRIASNVLTNIDIGGLHMNIRGRHGRAIHHPVVHVDDVAASRFNGYSGDNAFGNRINFSTAVCRKVSPIVIARDPKDGTGSGLEKFDEEV